MKGDNRRKNDLRARLKSARPTPEMVRAIGNNPEARMRAAVVAMLKAIAIAHSHRMRRGASLH
jgi:hypothetical protein